MADFDDVGLSLGETGPGAAMVPDIGREIANVSDLSGAAGGGGGGGFWSGLRDIGATIGGGIKDFGNVMRNINPLLGLGAGVFGAVQAGQAASEAGRQAQIQRRAQETQQGAIKAAVPIAQAAQTTAATPLTQFGGRELARAEAGTIDPAVQTQIDLWANGEKQKLRDYLSRAGIADSSTRVQWEAYIDQQAEAMKASELARIQNLGVTATQQGGGLDVAAAGALTGAGGAAGQAAGQAGQNQITLEQLIAEANKNLAALAGGAAT